MSFNLVDLVKNQISGQVLGQISNAVGENTDATKSVIDSAVPALLGGLMDKASSDEGASALFDTIKNQDDSILDNLSGVIASKSGGSLVESGSDALSSLFGGSAVSGLLGAVSGASGASADSTSKIMGMVAPMAMSTVKRFMAGGGEMDKAGLASMLMSQKDNIAGAMPSGLADQLGSSGLFSNVSNLIGGGAVAAAGAGLAGAAGSAFDKAGASVADAADTVGGAVDKAGDMAGDAVDGVTGAVSGAADSVTGAVSNAADGAANLASSATDAVSDAAGSAKDAAASAVDSLGDAAEGSGSWIKKLIPIAVLAAAAFLALKFFGGNTEAPDVSGEAPAAAATSMMAGGGDVTEQLKGMFSSAQTSLGSITDVESAKEALPKLEDFSGKLDGITAMADKLPDAAKPMFNTVVQGGMGQLTPMLDKVMAIPGVGAVLGGVIEPLKEKLAALGG